MSELGGRFLLALTGHVHFSGATGEVGDRMLRGLLDTLGQVCDPRRFLALDSRSTAADEVDLARLFAGWVPEEIREEIGRLLAGQPPAPNRPATTPAPTAPPDSGALERLTRLLAEEFQSAEGVQVMASLSTLPTELMRVVSGSMPPPGSRWDIERVAKLIRDFCVEWLSRFKGLGLPGENTKRVMREIDTELLGPLEKRLAVAALLSIGGKGMTSVRDLRSLTGLPSASKAGMEVHERLQAEYRRTRPTRLIVQESIVYRSGKGTSLKRAYKNDDTLMALWWARDSYLLKTRKALRKSPIPSVDESSLRDDNLDLGIPPLPGSGTIWEIKPIRGAPAGVVQEFAYRTLFNMAVAILKDLPRFHAVLRAPRRKPVYFSCEHVEMGTLAGWPEVAHEVLVLSRSAAEGGARTILVTMVSALPGLVLYVRFDLPAYLVAALAREVAKALDKASKELEGKVRTALAWAAVVATVCVAVLAAFAAVYAAALAAEAAAVEALLAAGAGVLARLGAQLPQILESLRRVVDQVTPLVQEFGLTMEPARDPAAGTLRLRFRARDGVTPDQLPTTDATVGPLHFENCPLTVLASLEDALAVAQSLACIALYRTIDTGPGGPVTTS
ncbi:hypothetical protein [Streptomyces sp. NPDC060027]|uniref:hypothetical protein n=1 Tax=Streptomyces sp. NPDC060027 TaxID=3347040 RepID=UPI003692C69A